MSRTIDTLTPGSAEAKTTTFPAPGRSSDASGARPYLAFDAATDEASYWTLAVPQGYTSPFTVVITYAMASATSGNTIWDATFEAITAADALDTDTSEGLDTANTSAASAVQGTAGFTSQVSITCTNDDGAVAADYLRIRIRRVGSNGSDTATGDALFYCAEVRDAA